MYKNHIAENEKIYEWIHSDLRGAKKTNFVFLFGVITIIFLYLLSNIIIVCNIKFIWH